MPSLTPPACRGRGSSAAPSDHRRPSPQRMVLRYAVEAGARDDLCSDLAHRSGLTKSRIKQALSKGAVWIKRPKGRRRRVRRATTRLHSGDRVELYYDAAILARQPPASECIDDHRGFSVWYKPAGMLTQGTDFGDHCSLMRAVQKAFRDRRPVHPVHRLDREAQGLVLVAHDRSTAGSLSALFRRRQVKKGYHAVVQGRLEDASGFRALVTPLDGKPAVTRYRAVRYDCASDRTVVEIRLETGRRHQLRRHFDAIGHPVLGDPRYGDGNQDPSGLQLWASSLAFTCPQCRREHVYTRQPALAAGDQTDVIRNHRPGETHS